MTENAGNGNSPAPDVPIPRTFSRACFEGLVGLHSQWLGMYWLLESGSSRMGGGGRFSLAPRRLGARCRWTTKYTRMRHFKKQNSI